MRKYMLIGLVGMVAGVLLTSAVMVLAGSTDSSAAPDNSSSQMYILEDIYDRLSGNGNATKMTSFTEPASGPPTGTMHTLDEIYELAWPARVPKTGQTTSYEDYDDGWYSDTVGVDWPDPRFTDNGDGTVTDNLTGLIWLKNANCFGTRNWSTALNDANTLNTWECGLNDGSSEGDWRLPNRFELESLLDLGNHDPALPTGHPFTGVQSGRYWSGTTVANNSHYAWYVYLNDGYVNSVGETFPYYVWPVRGGQ